MTTGEKIEAMEAFERGEEIQYVHKRRENRIKPKRKKRHPEGIKFVYRCEAGIPNPKILVITSVETPVIKGNKKPYEQDRAIYILTGIKTTDKNAVVIMDEDNLEKELIRADDCLWYWDVLDSEGEWFHTNDRCDKQKALEYYSGDTELIPLYALGFRLPKENK